MNVSGYTGSKIVVASWVWMEKEDDRASVVTTPKPAKKTAFAPLKPVREWLDGMEVRDRQIAHRLCKMIPAQCPFERDVKLFGRTLFHIPPMCKLNPLYEQVVGLRFRALCYLADECNEDITAYC